MTLGDPVKTFGIFSACFLVLTSFAFGQDSTPPPAETPATASTWGTPNSAPQQAAPPAQEPVLPAATSAPVPPFPSGGLQTPNALLNGTAVKLRLSENVTSATAKAGQQIPFEVLEEVDVQGLPVISKGAQALATVTLAEPKRTMGRAGKLDINIDSVRLTDGEKAALSATRNEKGGGHTGAMTAGMVGTAIVFFPAAPLLLFVHGKDITIPKGTEITAFIAGDMKLDMAKFAPAGNIGGPAAPVPPAMASLTVESSVAGADIAVDGSFVGSTPSTVSVTPGQHTITVSKKGFGDWSRSMVVSGTAVRLSADLEATPAP